MLRRPERHTDSRRESDLAVVPGLRGEEVERMGLSIVRRVLVGAVIAAVVLSSLVLMGPRVQAATWTQDTAAEFGQDTLSGLEVIGSGAPAYLQLLKDSADWEEEAPPADPGAREGPAMAYDSFNGVAVMFGGYNSFNFNDTWEYSPGANQWAQTNPPTAPSPRAYSGLAYDSANKKTVLFGGVSDFDNEADTWEYNATANTWQQTTPAFSPPRMRTYHLTYVQSQGRVFLEGQNTTTLQMETWAYNAATDQWTNLAPLTQPSPRSYFALSYNANLDRVILFGGYDDSMPPGTTLGDTWEYNWGTKTWTQTTSVGPDARQSAGLSYMSSIPATFLYGGRSGTTYFTDTWRYPDTTGSHLWEYVVTQRSPPGRVKFGICDETSTKKSYVFGGLMSGGPASDTWAMGPAFRLQGSAASIVFDSGGANVVWNTISWVGSASPPTTVLRFQLATSNDPTGPWTWKGPGGSTSTYYTTSGTAIWTGHSGERYMRFFAPIYTWDDLISPTLDSITIDYTVAPSNPYIIMTDPTSGQNSIPTSKLIVVRFSETMIPASVNVDISPFIPTSNEWSETNSKLTINHTAPFLQCKTYTVTITGTDLSGNPLINGPVANPWSFSTVCVPPKITSTSPYQGEVDVPLNANIIVNFSEPMDTATVVPAINPLIGLNPTWSNGDMTVTYSHTTGFTQCLDYEVNVTGKDLDGKDLIAGPAPNPWTFRVVCTIPYVVSTTPSSLQIDVALSASVVVTFSKPMNTGSVLPNISPGIILSPTWSNFDKTVTYTHAAFPPCTAYTVNMTGMDTLGNDLWVGRFDGFADNPWTFVTQCGYPYIVFTLPADRATGVDRLADIVVQFNKAMNNATVTYDLQPPVPLTSSWDTDNKVLMLNHTDKFVCGVNQMTITGQDTSGNNLVDVLAPNPWTFTPLCLNPYVTSTDPVNDSFGVLLDKDIVVGFNKPMNPNSLVYSLTPSDVTFTKAWSGGDTIVTFSHTTPFVDTRLYEFFVDGADTEGNGLIPASIPNPFWFTTVGAAPYIVSTEPPDQAVIVPRLQDIVVTFSEAMNKGMTSCALSPPDVPLTPAWTIGDTVLTLSHTTRFSEMTPYTVTCTGEDVDGNGLGPGPVPNPWHFSTTSLPRPMIQWTDPADGAVGVLLTKDIIVNFSKPMNIATIHCELDPPDVTLTAFWGPGNFELTLTHSTPLTPNTAYTLNCTGQDTDGFDLVLGPVPNPWTFTTAGIAPPEAPGGLMARKVPPSIVRLTWRAVTGADSYRIYQSPDRFAMFPWAVLGTTTATTYDANHLADGQTHFYIVRAVKGSLESANSTMAAKIEKSIGYGPTSANIYWFSLPYDSGYVKAGDISTELTSSKISVVAKWNPASQRPVLWYYLRNKWRGTNFTINDGDGLYIGSVSAFSWAIVGTDPSTILSFTKNSPPKKNVNWISVPYTGIYSKASDIANELTSSKVTEIGLWNPLTQAIEKWFWTGSSWSGNDFEFSPGDGIYITIASDFTWEPSLITPEVA